MDLAARQEATLVSRSDSERGVSAFGEGGGEREEETHHKSSSRASTTLRSFASFEALPFLPSQAPLLSSRAVDGSLSSSSPSFGGNSNGRVGECGTRSRG
jgi:hypothetical protein